MNAAGTHVWVAVWQQKGLGHPAAPVLFLVLGRLAGWAGVGSVFGECQPRLLGRARRCETVRRAVRCCRPRIVFNGCHCVCVWCVKLSMGIFGRHLDESPTTGAPHLLSLLRGACALLRNNALAEPASVKIARMRYHIGLSLCELMQGGA